MKNCRYCDIMVVSLIVIIFAYIYIGFFSPAPYHIHRYSILKYIQWSAWIGIPFLGFLVLLLYAGIRIKRVSAAAITLLVCSSLLTMLLGYFFLSHLYLKPHIREKLNDYHPYLQSCPQDYQPRENPSNAPSLKIFCLGGSTTEWSDSKNRDWPSYLEERLKGAVPDRLIECHNFGKPFYTTLNSLINYEVNLRQHKPDVVIIMHAINDLLVNADFSRLSTGEFHEDYRHFLGPLSRVIKRQSVMRNIREMMYLIWYYKPREIINTDKYPGLVSSERNLRTLIDLARIDGTIIILMTQPFLYKDDMTAEEKAVSKMLNFSLVNLEKQWNFSTAKRGMEKYNDLMRRLAQDEEGVYLVDLESAIPKSLDYFHDDVHYRDKTYIVIAEYIAERIKELDILAK